MADHQQTNLKMFALSTNECGRADIAVRNARRASGLSAKVMGKRSQRAEQRDRLFLRSAAGQAVPRNAEPDGQKQNDVRPDRTDRRPREMSRSISI
jgi:hypothetical protein